MTTHSLEQIYGHRFSESDVKAMDSVWKVLVPHYFQRFIEPDDTVLDIGAGRCQFINNVRAKRRIAMDANPQNAGYCEPGVEFMCASELQPATIPEGADVVFMSNFLEHLDNSNAVLAILAAIRTVLKPAGRVVILQPNFALLGAAYFDFIDHKTILTHKNLREALEISGFTVSYERRRFLPYTSKSRLPKWPILVRLYLALSPLQYLLGKQTVMVGTPR